LWVVGVGHTFPASRVYTRYVPRKRLRLKVTPPCRTSRRVNPSVAGVAGIAVTVDGRPHIRAHPTPVRNALPGVPPARHEGHDAGGSPECPPFVLRRGYPSGAKLVLGRRSLVRNRRRPRVFLRRGCFSDGCSLAENWEMNAERVCWTQPGSRDRMRPGTPPAEKLRLAGMIEGTEER